MRFGSICSGIGGAECALLLRGWTHVFSAEIDPFASAVLEHQIGGTNFGDITTAKSFPRVDALVGGTPCQSFSLTGSRQGMDDPRGQLAIRFAEIAAEVHAEWIIWENVHGVCGSGRGRDFLLFRRGLADLGYGLAWRVLDSSDFGTPQRRRRVFVVGCRSGVGPAAAVLLADSPSSRGYRNPADKVRQREDASGAVGWSGDTTPKLMIESTPTLRAEQGGEKSGFVMDGDWYRYPPEYMERLQGFPIGWTNIDGASDAKRYKALGNAFHVDAFDWIAKRIEAVNNA